MYEFLEFCFIASEADGGNLSKTIMRKNSEIVLGPRVYNYCIYNNNEFYL